MTLVDIILTSYNKEKYLRETLESLLNQTFKDFRLIIIDDKSNDNSIKILKRKISQGNMVLLNM